MLHNKAKALDDGVLLLPNSLTIFTVRDIATDIATICSERHPLSRLDFVNCEEIDGAGAQFLLCLIKQAQAESLPLSFSNVTPNIRTTLHLFGKVHFKAYIEELHAL